MVKVMQDDAGDEANHEPESRQKSCLESGRHAFNHVTDWQVTPGRIRYEGRRVRLTVSLYAECRVGN
jgi:hypothetical protein